MIANRKIVHGEGRTMTTTGERKMQERNPRRMGVARRQSSALIRLPLATAIYLAMGSGAFAQESASAAQPKSATADSAQEATPATAPAAVNGAAPSLGTVTVTAQKRVENLQKVPISISVLGEEKLKQQNVTDFTDFALLLPSVSFGSAGGGVFPGPGFVQVYMRGLSSGDNGNHSGPQPSVGMYLDEQPITTIQGALDIHVYDIERIEASPVHRAKTLLCQFAQAAHSHQPTSPTLRPSRR